MAYIERSDYDTFHPGNTLETQEFLFLAERASDIIDRETLSKIALFGITNFSTFTQERIKKAVSAQVDTLFEQGGISALTGTPTAIAGSVTIGRYSESNTGKSGSGSGISLIDSIPVSPLVRSYLQPTNLLNRAINREWRLEDFR